MKKTNKLSSVKALLLLSVVTTGFFFQTTFAEEINLSPNAPFGDVNSNTDYKESIDWMYKDSIINGYNDGTFRPDKCVSRAEILKMLFKILEIDYEKSNAELFPDTPADFWYAPYIRTARERGTIKGYADGKFRPDQCVNRAEAIKMAILEFNDGKIPEYDAFYGDSKDNDKNAWYYKFLNYALYANLVGRKHTKQIENGFYFYPGNPMSRKEVAEMLYRMKTIKDIDIKTYEQGYKPYAIVLQSAKVNFELYQVLLTSSHDPETGDTFEFDIYLERPDLGLKQNITYEDEMPLTVDLPLGLQPKLMYLSEINDTDPETGSMCDRPRFPHRCSVTLKGDELNKSGHEYLIKITFEDDTYVAKTITVPHPKALAKPEIMGPPKTPAQNNKFDVEFKDVGADTYDVSVSLCKPYNNDGINPCLDGTQYHISWVKDTDDFVITYEGDKSATVNAQNGFINVRSDFPLVFEESMSYNITAESTGKTSTNVKYMVKSYDNKYYPVNSVE